MLARVDTSVYITHFQGCTVFYMLVICNVLSNPVIGRLNPTVACLLLP